MKATPDNVYRVLNNLCNTTSQVKWDDMVDAIRAAGIVVTNWMTQVRGVLQWMINQGQFKRVPDVTAEIYECCK